MKPSEVLNRIPWSQGGSYVMRDGDVLSVWEYDNDDFNEDEVAYACALGAIGLAYQDEQKIADAAYKLVNHLDIDLDEYNQNGDTEELYELSFFDAIADWNDAEERTEKEVIAALEAAGL